MCSACSGDYEDPDILIDAAEDRYGCQYEPGDRGGIAMPPCGCKQCNDSQEQIIAASRSARAGTEMLFSALKTNGVFSNR